MKIRLFNVAAWRILMPAAASPKLLIWVRDEIKGPLSCTLTSRSCSDLSAPKKRHSVFLANMWIRTEYATTVMVDKRCLNDVDLVTTFIIVVFLGLIFYSPKQKCHLTHRRFLAWTMWFSKWPLPSTFNPMGTACAGGRAHNKNNTFPQHFTSSPSMVAQADG